MHSHHSHSGEYISHGEGSLESMVATAQARKFSHYCLTEHMPRLSGKYLYPEEIEKNYTAENLDTDFSKYLTHARKIQTRLRDAGSLQVLVGFEVEGIDGPHIRAAKSIRQKTDMCVGSVHYVHGIPIDFSAELWLQARAACADNTSRCLYKDYFDLQYQVLTELHPHVVGHFDLIRLCEASEIDSSSGIHIRSIDIEQDWPDVWQAITRNIQYVVSYGGLFELNSSAVRKGWVSPYPRLDIAQAIKRLGGMFCLSDDAHTTAQVGLNYDKVWAYVVDELRLSHVHHLELDAAGNTVVVADRVAELARLSFWA
ncbi:histidinol phosphate phosphatase H [Metschnikowia bicuspidata var. bicuspidata NRRL YB-4993]|uniref:Histidinol-phosphatase n=1 Tax=Metschnikowia bicuspidata var. bicuspidata NRRL YB-4993 TaxID=869754 RepID=A0A1A0H8F1_9ASCO|nr:histidinol phosphate phosphatase H [Metschnikowia bicuspidata var. bicuspidata NRRL YB-4993]OBA20301.1 histidinol phosphate phosphatase H [Metschnikowia bicuspidata var. bicuspidata NRRL YB-4993]